MLQTVAVLAVVVAITLLAAVIAETGFRGQAPSPANVIVGVTSTLAIGLLGVSFIDLTHSPSEPQAKAPASPSPATPAPATPDSQEPPVQQPTTSAPPVVLAAPPAASSGGSGSAGGSSAGGSSAGGGASGGSSGPAPATRTPTDGNPPQQPTQPDPAPAPDPGDREPDSQRDAGLARRAVHWPDRAAGTPASSRGPATAHRP